MMVMLLMRMDELGSVYRFFNSIPLRAVGIVGYSFYLFHWMGKDIARSVVPRQTSMILFIFLSILITYAISCCTYAWIERPCMQFARTVRIPFMSRVRGGSTADHGVNPDETDSIIS